MGADGRRQRAFAHDPGVDVMLAKDGRNVCHSLFSPAILNLSLLS